MPEIEITKRQAAIVINRICEQNFDPLIRDFYDDFSNSIWMYKDEPLVILWKEKPDMDEMGYFGVDDPDQLKLYCSGKHAKEFEEAGVLKFAPIESGYD